LGNPKVSRVPVKVFILVQHNNKVMRNQLRAFGVIVVLIVLVMMLSVISVKLTAMVIGA
jgi:hypothetical protein